MWLSLPGLPRLLLLVLALLMLLVLLGVRGQILGEGAVDEAIFYGTRAGSRGDMLATGRVAATRMVGSRENLFMLHAFSRRWWPQLLACLWCLMCLLVCVFSALSCLCFVPLASVLVSIQGFVII